MSDRLHHGRLKATIADVIDAGVEMLPEFEQAAIAVLDNAERPAEWPAVRRKLRAEGVRASSHRGVLLLEPGELDRFSSVGLFGGFDELYLTSEWNDELEPFPSRITPDVADFSEASPLGLEEWMLDVGCVLALGDGEGGVNFATLDGGLADRLIKRFQTAKR